MYGESPTITTVYIDESFYGAKPTSLSHWFCQSSDEASRKLSSISGLENIDTSMVTSMAGTFSYLSNVDNFEAVSE